MKRWISTKDRLPPVKKTVLTKIDDEKGVRNERKLKLWETGHWFEPSEKMYMYYCPTHWWGKV